MGLMAVLTLVHLISGSPVWCDEAESGEVIVEEQSGTQTHAHVLVSPVEPSAEGSAQAGTISVDFKDADIRQVLRILSLKSGVDIVAGPDVEGLVTIKLTSVPWEQALDIVLRTYGLTYDRKGNVIRVMSLEAVEQEALGTEVFPLNYAKSKEVMDIVKEMLTDRGKVKFDDRTNTVIVTDLPASLFQLKQVIERLDRQTPQVHIESRFVETRLTRDENLGIDWFDSMQLTVSPATSSTTFPFRTGATYGKAGEAFLTKPGDLFYTGTSAATNAVANQGFIPNAGGQFVFGTITLAQLNTTINMLKQRVDTRVISNPTIVTLNNQEASVQVGTDVNIPNFQVDPSTGRATVSGFQTRSTGIILKVKPQVNLEQEIVMDVKPEITTVGSDRTYASGITFPDFDVQKAQTQVRLVDGQTLAIGGLKRQAERVTQSKIPILGDLPIVGVLFSNRREQTPSGQDQLDLLIFMTVHLVKDKAKQAVAAASP
ncbi:MAG: secretin and TonB N-terminal domain-containing protein [Candidatus Omnitrophica bacterium]|nr:secretin and TonB N-terminal domain-containing protein [Candidatus Omnitrophota bacterium]